MNYFAFLLDKKIQLLPDTFLMQLLPIETKQFSFLPGQYVLIKNPHYMPHEEHPFSIASSPHQKNFLEFCIKVYGDWTQNITLLKEGSTLLVSEPLGEFVWDIDIQHATFLLGGIGISPIMSMLRFLVDSDKKPQKITILYGNRTPQTIAYKKELQNLTATLPLKIINIFSDLPLTHPWSGYRGFITDTIVKKEIDLSMNQTFFIIGPPIFIEKMQHILLSLTVKPENIKVEKLSKHTNNSASTFIRI